MILFYMIIFLLKMQIRCTCTYLYLHYVKANYQNRKVFFLFKASLYPCFNISYRILTIANLPSYNFGINDILDHKILSEHHDFYRLGQISHENHLSHQN